MKSVVSSVLVVYLLRLLAVTGQDTANPSCSLCPPGHSLSLPDEEPSNSFGGTDGLTCGVIEANANAGIYSPATCALIRFRVKCGCLAPPTAAPVATGTTEAPVVAVATTDAPVVASVTTDAPVVVSGATDAPVATTVVTESPVAAAVPTDAPAAATGTTDAPATTTGATDAPVVGSGATDVPTGAPVVDTSTTEAPATASGATEAPVASAGNQTMAPTTSPAVSGETPVTDAPTLAPATASTNSTMAPTAPVEGNSTGSPTASPIAANVTEAPTVTPATVNTTEAPTVARNVTVNTTGVPTASPVVTNVTGAPAVTNITLNATGVPTMTPANMTSGPTASPVANTTANVTDAPTTLMNTSMPTTAAVTAMPTSSPVTVRDNLEGLAFVRLEGVTSPLSDEAIQGYEKASSAFLNLRLAGIVVGTSCSVINQNSLRRRSLRVLQDASSSVELELSLSGESSFIGSEEFGKQCRAAFNDPGYVNVVKSAHVAFDAVTSANADSTTAVSPVDSRDIETPNDSTTNRGLQIGMIIAIILGLLIASVSIAAGAYYLVRSGSNSTPSVVTPIQEYPVESNKSPEIAPATSPPSAADSSVGIVPPATSEVESSFSEGKDNSAMKSLAGESEMEGYSVAAGHVEGGTAAGSPSVGEATGTSASGDEMSSHAMSSLKQNMVSRTVIAPPGKLGIVIDTTLEGPVVHKVNGQSPLEGSLFPGDIIVAIDDIDTRAMSASAITALMVRTANLRRTLTVLSEDNST